MITFVFGIILGVLLPIKETSAMHQNIVEHATKSFEMQPLFWTIGIIGGCIAMTLIFVSWRKFKAEKKKRSNNNSSP